MCHFDEFQRRDLGSGVRREGEGWLGAIGNFRQKRIVSHGPCLRDEVSQRCMAVFQSPLPGWPLFLACFPEDCPVVQMR